MKWQDREREMQQELKALEAIAGSYGRKDLGNLTLAAENARAVRRWGWVDGLIADLRYAFRVLRRQPAFAAVAVHSLGSAASVLTAVALCAAWIPRRDSIPQRPCVTNSDCRRFTGQRCTASGCPWRHSA